MHSFANFLRPSFCVWAFILLSTRADVWIPRTVLNSTSTSLSAAPPVTSVECCALFAGPVNLATWFNSTFSMVVATVVTQYLQYNNTVITTSTTITNTSATSIYGTYLMGNGPGIELPGIPTDILGDAGDAVYQATVVAPIGAVSGPGGPISSPTQFMYVNNASALYQVASTFTSTWVNTLTPCGTTDCHVTSTMFDTETGFDNGISCATAYTSYWLSGSTEYSTTISTSTIVDGSGDPFIQGEEGPGNGVVVFNLPESWVYTLPVNKSLNYHNLGGDEFLPFPEDFVTYLAEIPGNLQKFPGFTTCVLGAVSGQPSVHIPVAELTSSSSTVIHVGGVYSGSSSSSKPETTPKTTPASTTVEPDSSPTKGSQSPSSPEDNSPTNSPSPAPTTNAPASTSNAPEPGTTQTNQGESGGDEGSGTTSNVPSPAIGSPTTVSIDSARLTVTPLSSGGVVIPGGATLHPGSATVIKGTTISLGSSGTALVIGSTTVALPGYVTTPAGSFTASIGGSLVQLSLAPSSAGILLPNGQTLAPGSTTILNGEGISLAPSGSALVVGSSTMPIAGTASGSPGFVVTVNGKAISLSYAVSSAGLILPNGQTLAPGSITSMNGEVISLAPSETALVVGSSTIPLAPPTENNAGIVVTIDGKPETLTYAPSGAGLILPNGQTLAPGSTTAFDGVGLSLGPSESSLVIGTSTLPLAPVQTTGIGGYVASGLGGGSQTTSQYTGEGNGLAARKGPWIRACGAIGAIVAYQMAI